ncbi:unnamed protein product [Rhizophagus irregularis]|nr:unnamed protein product [Rhizophagus irregularis]
MEEIELIFKQISNEMEWEKINVEALQSIKNEHGLTTPGEVKTWVLKTNNFLRLGQKIISIAEQSKIMSEYMTMNEEFRKCLTDENRRTDEKETGEKRPVPETLRQQVQEEDEKSGGMGGGNDFMTEQLEIASLIEVT